MNSFIKYIQLPKLYFQHFFKFWSNDKNKMSKLEIPNHKTCLEKMSTSMAVHKSECSANTQPPEIAVLLNK